MNRHLNNRKLHMESLEDRCLLAVVAGGMELSAAFADVAPHATLADDQMEFALVITDALPVAAEVADPTVSVGDGINLITETPFGETVYISLYVKSLDADYGVQRGYCSLRYDAAGLTPVAYYSGLNFDSLTINDSFDFSTVGNISAFGGEPSDFGAAYGKTGWALVGTMSFSADVVGQYEFTTGTAVNGKGEEKESWGFVREDFEDTYEYSIPDVSASLAITGEMPVIEDVTVEGWTGGYDGLGHSITVIDPSAETDKILFSTDGINYNLDVCPEYTEDGVYTTYVRVTRTGFSNWYGSATVEIHHVAPVVTTLEDVVDSEDGVISLREAIGRAIEGDVITFDSSLAGGTITLNGTRLDVNVGISIDASDIGGITIDANGLSRVFYTSGGTENTPIEFISLTMTGGYTTGGGGAIYNSNGIIKVDACRVVNSIAESSEGGGIYSESGSLAVIGSTVSDNYARGEGGGIYNGSNNTLVVINSVFLRNRAIADQGGGIYNKGILNVTHSTFLKNQANDGGGICNIGSTMLTNSTLSGNSVNFNGGGIDNYGTLTIINSSFLDNSTNFEYIGGGICNNSSSELIVINSIFAKNFTPGRGGAIFNAGTLKIVNSTLTGNSAKKGSGINNSGTTTLLNTVIELNAFDTEWTDIYNDRGIINAYNTLSSFTDWTESTDCLVYDSTQPLFEDAQNGDYTLAKYSQALDKGDNSYVESETDLAGNQRIVNGVVDLGAYERQELALTVMLTGTRGNYVSYGANRHRLEWKPVADAQKYELAYSTDGLNWTRIKTEENFAIVSGLTYGDTVSYRVRALGEGVFIDADWSDVKSFDVCPMDINNDGMISGLDRSLMASAWGTEEGDDKYRFHSDINADGDVGGLDRNFLGSNWGAEAGDEDLTYPRPVRAADAVFDAYDSGDIEVDLNLF